jgi:hypothetical protein
LKEQDEFRRPEHWGVRPDSALAREMNLGADARVLVPVRPREAPLSTSPPRAAALPRSTRRATPKFLSSRKRQRCSQAGSRNSPCR